MHSVGVWGQGTINAPTSTTDRKRNYHNYNYHSERGTGSACDQNQSWDIKEADALIRLHYDLLQVLSIPLALLRMASCRLRVSVALPLSSFFFLLFRLVLSRPCIYDFRHSTLVNYDFSKRRPVLLKRLA